MSVDFDPHKKAEAAMTLLTAGELELREYR